MMKRPNWCPHNDCLFGLETQNKMCIGKLSKPQPHDDDYNTHRLCIDTRETENGVFDLQINKTDAWNLSRILKSIIEAGTEKEEVFPTDSDIEREALSLAKKHAKQSLGDFAVGFNFGAKLNRQQKEKEKPQNLSFEIFIDQKAFVVNQVFITGKELKSLVGAPLRHGLWLKSFDAKGDKEISDDEQVDLNQPYRNLYFTGSKEITEG